MVPPIRPRVSACGFTFTELMIVIALAGVVTLGLVTFYLNSQILWTDSSTQVIAQRDATSLIELMRRSAQGATIASVDQDNRGVAFLNSDLILIRRFFWSPGDSLIHYGVDGNPDRGPLAPTVVEAFQVNYDPSLGMLDVDTLRVRSTSGQRVTMSTSIGLYNR